MLVLFAFSGTPKRFLHDLVAHHKDTKSKFSPGAHTSVERSFYNCHTEDLVVESPFVEAAPPAILPAPSVVNETFTQLIARLYVVSLISTSLRGPPALG